MSQICNTVNYRSIADSRHVNVRVTCLGGQNTVYIYCAHLIVLFILSVCSDQLGFLYNDVNKQHLQNFFRLLILLIQPFMFYRQIRTSSVAISHCIYIAFCTMHRHCCQLVSSSVDALYWKLYIVKMCSWEWENFSSETCRG